MKEQDAAHSFDKGDWKLCRIFGINTLLYKGVISSITNDEICASLNELTRLRSELQHLQQWKKEQILVWGPILEYMQTHPELSIGESIAKRVLEFLKERDSKKQS